MGTCKKARYWAWESSHHTLQNQGALFDVSFLFKKTLLSSLPNKMEALGSEGHM
jgi:hypothetical protein